MLLTQEDILRGLARLDQMARTEGVSVELAIYGGAALVLVFNIRRATRDVDAVFGDPATIRRWARQISEEEHWPEDWLNDGVKGFVSTHEQMQVMDRFEGSATGGLRVIVPTPHYFFAMKCMAMRPEGIDGSHDIADIEALAEIAGVKDAEQATALVEAFYPSARIPAKVQFGIEEIMARVAARRESRRP